MIEQSEDKWGSELRGAYLEGREAHMEDNSSKDNPYRHQTSWAKAWDDGWEDEKVWALDSTGR